MPEFCLDNFRHPYIRFDEHFVWPSVHLINPLPEEIQDVRNLLKGRFPGFGDDFALWTNDPFSGNQKYLIFIATSDALKAQGMAFELRVLAAYAGGAAPGEIHHSAEQDRSPEFETDRIYFKAFMFPTESITYRDRETIESVDVQTFKEILEASRYTLTHDQKSIWATALFDSIDYSFIQDRLRALLGELEPWKPGALYPPLVIERMTFCLNLFDIDTAVRMAPAFRELIGQIQESDLSKLKSRDDWVRFNSAYELQRILSRGGNPHWRFSPVSERGSDDA